MMPEEVIEEGRMSLIHRLADLEKECDKDVNKLW